MTARRISRTPRRTSPRIGQVEPDATQVDAVPQRLARRPSPPPGSRSARRRRRPRRRPGTRPLRPPGRRTRRAAPMRIGTRRRASAHQVPRADRVHTGERGHPPCGRRRHREYPQTAASGCDRELRRGVGRHRAAPGRAVRAEDAQPLGHPGGGEERAQRPARRSRPTAVAHGVGERVLAGRAPARTPPARASTSGSAQPRPRTALGQPSARAADAEVRQPSATAGPARRRRAAASPASAEELPTTATRSAGGQRLVGEQRRRRRTARSTVSHPDHAGRREERV